MANFKRLTMDVMPETKVDVNMDCATFVEPGDSYTRIHFSKDHAVDVRETPDQIRNISKLSNA